MPCCKAKEFNDWCKGFPVVPYHDEKGEYCVFHAPKGKKDESAEKFNEYVFTAINDAKKEKKVCNLAGTIFEWDIDFKQFKEDNTFPEISFNEATFEGRTYFNHTIFEGSVSFEKAKFSDEVDFINVKFQQPVHFFQATFKGKSFFERSTFHKITYFDTSTFNDEVYFSGATFVNPVTFTLVSFKKYSQFYSVDFQTSANFSQSKFYDLAEFVDRTFLDTGSLSYLFLFGRLRLEAVNLKKVSFLNTDLRKIDFTNCKWNQHRGRRILYNELKILQSKKRNYKKEYIKKVEILYRRLKQKYKEEHDNPEISDWHYGEKEMYRKGSRFRRYFPFSMSNLYWLSSGYGERPFRAGISLFILILIISIFLASLGLNSFNGNPVYKISNIKIDFSKEIFNINYFFIKIKKLWLVSVNTLQYATFEKTPYFKPETSLGDFFKLLARILIPLQAALFGLAVRNRFRR